nr:MAG TPA: hypothetical protein [Caudoviricetes sp.]DAN10042.1 MAG TPA: hypothetical protein [Caudoviricetes sp.]DAN10625.1 MAG TPA: hypothetical protein [Caudoviricetes sp.]
MRYNAAELFRLFLYPYIIKFNCVEFGSGNARRPALRAEQLVTQFFIAKSQCYENHHNLRGPAPRGAFSSPVLSFPTGAWPATFVPK